VLEVESFSHPPRTLPIAARPPFGPGGRGHGFPRSHGPFEAIVNRRAVTIWLTLGASGALSPPRVPPKPSLPEPSRRHIFDSNAHIGG
jgi:hypothetical protein